MKRNVMLGGLIALLMISCSSSKEYFSGTDGFDKPDENTLRTAIESRRFIIKFDHLYNYGSIFNLRPRSNYIIVDGDKAVIRAAYVGRQYDVRPISGINMRGITSDYEVTNKLSKGSYNIKMKVQNRGTVFDVFLSIGKDGNANASINSIRIENIRYKGYIIPLGVSRQVPLQEENDAI
ncbi:MAG TPA: DUF4251 domain-containing protein [Bacteroidales bacterium]|nr:DUF4251 domain-containing protein [Bacteroidales bacterium]